MNRARMLRAFFLLITICGVATWIVPWILFATSAEFPHRLPATLLFFAVVSEKLWPSLLRMPDKVAVVADKDWTVAAVGLAYLAVIYAILYEIYGRLRALPSMSAAVLGGMCIHWRSRYATVRCGFWAKAERFSSTERRYVRSSTRGLTVGFATQTMRLPYSRLLGSPCCSTPAGPCWQP